MKEDIPFDGVASEKKDERDPIHSCIRCVQPTGRERCRQVKIEGDSNKVKVVTA